jgi:hypothetical protein
MLVDKLGFIIMFDEMHFRSCIEEWSLGSVWPASSGGKAIEGRPANCEPDLTKSSALSPNSIHPVWGKRFHGAGLSNERHPLHPRCFFSRDSEGMTSDS